MASPLHAPAPKTDRTPLRVRILERGDVSVLEVDGRLDETFEMRLAGALDDLLERKRVRAVADLSRLAFLNSRGVSVFIAAIDQFRAAGGDLKLAGAPPQARLVLKRLGVDRILQQFATVDEALPAFEVPIGEFLSQGGIDVFVAGPRSKTFHSSGCAKVKRLKSVRILSSKKAARDAGLMPCARCGAE